MMYANFTMKNDLMDFQEIILVHNEPSRKNWTGQL